MALTFEIDYAQWRLKKARVRSSVTGRVATEGGGSSRDGWSATYGEDVWVEPVRKTLMLKPGPIDDDWNQSNSGIFAKLQKASFTFTTSAKWLDKEGASSGDKRIQGVGDTTAEKVITTAAWGQNVGVSFGWFAYNVGTGHFDQWVCGFGTDTMGTDDSLWFKGSSDGSIEVYYDTTLLYTGTLEGKDIASSRDGGGGQTMDTFNTFMAIPLRGREILVYSRLRGGGFTVYVPESLCSDPASLIRSTDKFFFYFPAGSAEVQVGKVQYKSSGYALSVGNVFPVLPTVPDVTDPLYESGAVVDDVLGTGTATVSLRTLANAAYAGTQDHRIRVDLAGSGSATPFVRGAYAGWGPEIVQMDDSEMQALDSYLVAATLSVPDSHEGAELQLVVKNPRGAESDIPIHDLRRQTGRSIRVRDAVTDMVWFEGVVTELDWAQSANTEVETLEMRCRSLWYLLEDTVAEQDMVLDGMALEDAFRFIANSCGIPDSYLSYNPSGFTISDDPGPEDGHNFVWRRFERGSDAMNRLIETYAATYWIREVPGPGHVLFQLASPEELGTDYQATVWDTTAEATASSGLASTEIYRVLAGTYSEQILEPMANDIEIGGWDAHQNKPMLGHYADAEGADDPEQPPSARIDHWLGSRRIYIHRHSEITTEGAMDRVMLLSQQRLCPKRTASSWESQTLLEPLGGPVWRGDTVRVVAGTEDAGNVRVGSLEVAFELELDDRPWRPSRYAGQFLTDQNVGASTGTTGFTASDIRAEWIRKLGEIKGFQIFAVRRNVDGPPSFFKEYGKLW